MKKSIIILCFTALLAGGCESYLDRQPDESYTSGNIFEKYSSTFAYLVNVYSWIFNETDPSGQQNHFTPSSDEAACAFPSRMFALSNNSTWSVNSEDTQKSYKIQYWLNYYKGIREASYFIANVGRCPELTPDEVKEWAAEARFLRAYYYFSLMRLYGPVVLLGEKPVDFNDPALRDVDRNPWDECVEWVSNECDAAARDLPLEQSATFYGRATKGAALALKARLLLYSARPLFNGNPMYAGLKNAKGQYLFPQEPDAGKWTKAADAAWAVIDLNQYELINTGNPYTDLKNVFIRNWNNELIFAYQKSSYSHRVATIPRGVGGTSYGGVAVTQKLVDAFAMKNGRYPITGYEADGKPVIDAASGYSERGFSSFKHPILDQTMSTYNMYVDREPRFYTSVFYQGLKWIGGSYTLNKVEFYYGGNSGAGPSAGGSNYSLTGYLPFKFQDISFNSTTLGSNQALWTAITWPLFRYAEVLLNYAEALNEQPDRDETNALVYMNMIRNRAGVDDIEDVYPEVEGNKELLRKMILRERMLELNFENHRFFDTRTWAIAEQEDAGAVYGMNVMAQPGSDAQNSPFWERTVIASDGGNTPSTRVFQKKNYLLPIPQSEIDRLKNITQNYQW